MARRAEIAASAERIARPILEELGLELLEVALGGQGRTPTLRFVVDRPGGGVVVDELEDASREVERALEVSELLPGRHSLEFSSPGIDRPLKTLRDFERHLGRRVSLSLADPLPDGRRRLEGRVAAAAGGLVGLVTDGGETLELPLAGIKGARPLVDWRALLRGRSPGGTAAPKEESR